MRAIIENIENEKKNRTDNRSAWKTPNLKPSDYQTLMKYFGNYYCDIKSPGTRFIIDDCNKGIYEQLYFYLKGDSENCKLNLYRGIYLCGAIGSGKTVLMNTFLSVQDYLTHHIIKRIHSKSIAEYILSQGVQQLKCCPLFIDDVGRENLEDIDYGKKIKPFTDIISMRYEEGALTFATSNFTVSKLEGDDNRNGYGRFITTRMLEMFNIVELKGGNRRKGVSYECK